MESDKGELCIFRKKIGLFVCVCVWRCRNVWKLAGKEN